MLNVEVVTGYYIVCKGVSPSGLEPLGNSPTQASITLFQDGSRQIGCPYLKRGHCSADIVLQEDNFPKCCHLFPESNREEQLTSQLPQLIEPLVFTIDELGRRSFRPNRLPKDGVYELDSLSLPTAARNALVFRGLAYIAEVRMAHDQNLFEQIPNLGEKRIAQIKQALENSSGN